MPAFIDLTGRSFGRWTVTRRAENNRHNQPQWFCRCECGTEGIVNGQTLRNGISSSCGCYNKEINRRLIIQRSTTHGHAGGTRSLTYRRWRSMRDRCRPESPAAYVYAEKGIQICDRWNSFENFLADLGECPSPKHSLDRIDGTRGYEPGNCRWATMKEQQNNRTNNRMITFNGKTMTLAQWGEHTGIDRTTIAARIDHYGWPVGRALTEGVSFAKRRSTG